MAYPAYIKDKARQLRIEKRLTIDELAERLAISRTTIYYWVKDLPIGTTENERLASRRAGEASRRIHARRRAAAYAQGQSEYESLSTEKTFRDFVCMYIGEGYKRNRNTVAICNSDPAVVRLGADWIRRLTDHPIEFAFQHHADQDPEEVCAFWGALLSIDPETIKFQRKSNSGQLAGRIWRSKYGVLQIRTQTHIFERGSERGWMRFETSGPRLA